jgi:hypothetical protein
MVRIPQKGRKARWEAVRTFSSASVTTSFQAVGTVTINPAQILVVSNDSTESIEFSFDGVTTQGYVRTASDRIYNLGGNTQDTPNMECMELPANTQIYIKGTTAGTGTIAFEVIYQSSV